MPTVEQLKFRKTLVDEVRLIRRTKILFAHYGYVRWRGKDTCNVCILGGLVAAAMNRKGQYLPFIQDPTKVTDEVFGRPKSGAGWAHSAVADSCGLSMQEAYTLEAVYEQNTNTMVSHDLDEEEIDSVDHFLCQLDAAWDFNKLTDDEMAEKILQVLEKSADHPEGKLDWGLSD